MRIILKVGISIICWLGLTAMTFATIAEQPLQLKRLSLDDCLKLGFQNHSTIIAAEHRITIAEKRVREKYGSFLPSVNYKINRTKAGIEQPSYDFFGNEITVSNKSDTYTEGISVTQILYAGGAIKADYQIALLSLESALEAKRRTEQELTYNIKSAFYDLWLKQQNYQTAQVSQENMAKHYQLINRMYQIGSRNKLELSQARVLWEEQKVAALMAGNKVAGARLTLAALIGVDKFQEFEAELDLSKIDLADKHEADPRPITTAAYLERPELRQMKQSVAIAEYQIKQAKAGLLPSLSLAGNYSLDGERLLSDDIKSWSLTLNLSGIAFDGFTTQNRIASAKENFKLTHNQELALREQVMTEVIQTLRSLNETKELVNSNRLNIDLARENIHLTEIQFNNGKATTSDFKNSQMSLNQALDGYYGQVISYLIYLAKLDYVTGKDASY